MPLLVKLCPSSSPGGNSCLTSPGNTLGNLQNLHIIINKKNIIIIGVFGARKKEKVTEKDLPATCFEKFSRKQFHPTQVCRVPNYFYLL